MTARNDGGPAFPHMMAEGHRDYAPGLSLRDWYAGQVLSGLVAYPGREGEDNKPEHFARWSYALADAMLAAREQES